MNYCLGALCIILLIFIFRFFNHKINHDSGHSHDKNILSIDYYAYTSNMRSWNASYKFYLSFGTLLLSIVLNNIYVSITVIIVMTYINLFKGKIPAEDYFQLLKIPVAFILLGTIAIIFGVSFKPLGEYNLSLHFFYIITSKSEIFKGISLIFKSFAAISSLYMLTLSTSTNEIISVINKAHVPKIVIELMNLIYRYIFIIFDVYYKMKNASESRLGTVDFKSAYYTFGNLSSNLLIVSLKKANGYYNAMLARCYDGDLIFLNEEKKVTSTQIILSILLFIFLILLYFYN